MKVGDYVRTDSGIDKIARIEKSKDILFCGDTIYCEHSTIPHWRNYKSSSDIIDLIEEDDFVNGVRITEIISNKNGVLKCMADSDYEFITTITNNEIESVLTKEQFESMEYKI